MQRRSLPDAPRFAEGLANDGPTATDQTPFPRSAPRSIPAPSKLDPLVEALGLAVARKATRDGQIPAR